MLFRSQQIFINLLSIFCIIGYSQDNTQTYTKTSTEDLKKLLINPNSIYEKESISKKIPIKYAIVKESDVGWSKIVWRTVDLREKINQVLYYPTIPMSGRKNLIDILLYGIKEHGLTAYNPIDDDFTEPITLNDIYEKFDASNSSMITVRNKETGELEEKQIENTSESVPTNEVLQYMIKEQWYFDKIASSLKVQIIGICPIRIYSKEDYNLYTESDIDKEETELQNDEKPDLLRMKLFWVYFPEVRPLLSKHEVFNPHNDAASISYDDLFVKRRFNSFIEKMSNVYDNRGVFEYNVSTDALYESERLKKMIIDFENDLWEY